MNKIINPNNGEVYSIFSSNGRNLLKLYLQTYKYAGSKKNGPFSLKPKGPLKPKSPLKPEGPLKKGPFKSIVQIEKLKLNNLTKRLRAKRAEQGKK